MAKDNTLPEPAPEIPAAAGSGRLSGALLADLVANAEVGADRKFLDYAMLAILVRVQHLRHVEALALVKGLEALGWRAPELLLARAIIECAMELNESVLATIRELDRLDPPEISKGRHIDERVRVRSFLKARAIFALTGRLDEEGRASIDFYLRQTRSDAAKHPGKNI